MTPKEAIVELEKDLKTLKDALCIHQDEFGTHYADQDAVDRMQSIVDTLGSFAEHQIDFVSDWMISVATMENGECVTALEAQWVEEQS